MTDREPLRVGPLVLRWVPRDHQWQYRLVGGRTLAITGFIDKLGEREIASARLLEQLERSGYLAQYRSRRRLLARECIERADYLDALGFGFSGGLGLKRRRNAAKLRALAEALRSP